MNDKRLNDQIIKKITISAFGFLISCVVFDLTQIAPDYLINPSFGLYLISTIWYVNLGLFYFSQAMMLSFPAYATIKLATYLHKTSGKT